MKTNRILTTIIFITIILVGIKTSGQVAINATGNPPNASAMLDVTSSDKGILVPRMTNSEIGNISPLSNGLLVYSTDDNAFYYYNNSQWLKIASGSSENPWLTNGSNIYFTTGNVGIGIASPNSKSILELSSTTKGILIPRLTSTQRSAISSPPSGLIVYQTDAPVGLYFYYTGGWRYLYNSSSIIPVSQGGTGVTQVAAGNIVFGDGTNPFGSSSNLTFDIGTNTLYFQGTINHTGGTIHSFNVETSGLTLDETYSIVLCNGSFTVNLPLSSSNMGRVYTIKNIGSGTVIIDPNSLEQIDGSSTYSLATKKSAVIICSGTAWHIISGF